MRARLYAKILGWFLLNLLLLVAAVGIFLRTQYDFDLNALVSGRAGSQVDALGRLIEAELRKSPPSTWDEVLHRYDAAYRVQFSLYRPDGFSIAGVTTLLPPEVESRLAVTHPRQPPPPPPNSSLPSPPEPSPGRFAKTLVHTRDPSAYWALLEIGLPSAGKNSRPNPGILVIRSETLNAGGLFFDVRPWLLAGALLVAASALFWLPFVRRITGSLFRMTEATKRIADGNFDVTLEIRSRDELGSLADSINRMAGRLDGFVSGQRRFLGDIAHELCAPLARMQVGLGILEERAAAESQNALADVREEVDQMSSLVNELLSFSKASLGMQNVKRADVDARAVTERAIRRETGGASGVVVEAAGDFHVLADENLLERALANLIRNAIRHSGDSQIVVTLSREDAGEIVISIADSGPGIPEEFLSRIFDPFFRPDVSRSRETGGAGLGLAIVKTCVELCGGSVTCRNRQPTGLEVLIQLEALP
jgi:two-component system, OmpR family, sensor histidine kinase CpxA